MLRLLTKWRTLASDCVSLASRPGLSGLGKMVAQCTRIAYVVWRGLRLLTTWRKSFVSYASARVSMSKICNRYLAKIDIWYNSNLWHSSVNSSVRLPNHYTRGKLEKVLAITSKDIHYFIYIIYYS